MWYNKYSNYAPDQIIDENYEKACNRLLTMVEDEKSKEIMKRYTI